MPIRVLIVDDAAVVRRAVSEVVAEDPDFVVAATASNGRLALARIPQVTPDVITLDIEMPEMDGLATLAAIRQSYPNIPVIMLSRFTKRGSVAALDALSLGAVDYLPLPEVTGGLRNALQYLKDNLLPRIKQFGEPAARANTSNSGTRFPSVGRKTPSSSKMRSLRREIDVLAIGVSTGGPNALVQVLEALPAGLPVPIVIVQHISAPFTKLLAERLTSRTPIPVSEATVGAELIPGRGLLAPGDHHMTIERDLNGVVRARLNQGPQEHGCRPAVDPLFRSVAKVYGAAALGVVLTGMGKDGLDGAADIRDAGGTILVQDEATSVVWGMPGMISRAGLADAVLPLDAIGMSITCLVQSGRLLSSGADVSRDANRG